MCVYTHPTHPACIFYITYVCVYINATTPTPLIHILLVPRKCCFNITEALDFNPLLHTILRAGTPCKTSKIAISTPGFYRINNVKKIKIDRVLSLVSRKRRIMISQSPSPTLYTHSTIHLWI